MEIWVTLEEDESPVDEGAAQHYVCNKRSDALHLEDDRLMDGGVTIGAYRLIGDGDGQRHAVSLMGSVNWLLVECKEWSMIPLENLIAARRGSHTKIAAIITSPLQAQGAGFALEEGVDALVVPNDPVMLEAALSVQAQRGEPVTAEASGEALQGTMNLCSLEVKRVEEAGLGDRYCLDFIASFRQNEGVLVGSSASTMFLIHSETIPSSFVPTRPFRVNAGSPHSYICMADGSTKYMSELTSGDRVMGVNLHGETRAMVLGRIKIEQRPMLKITANESHKNQRNTNESHVYMQQAETVRLISDDARPISVTELSPTLCVIGWNGHGARHLGVSIDSSVEER
ncbi:MAG: hypothetical protein DWC10_00710 [Candidatus Poseidoniales archaeon]|nr:MAG: hypothetical protein DWC10_00710 [Candidatus Poseidoniales archaeon]